MTFTLRVLCLLCGLPLFRATFVFSYAVASPRARDLLTAGEATVSHAALLAHDITQALSNAANHTLPNRREPDGDSESNTNMEGGKEDARSRDHLLRAQTNFDAASSSRDTEEERTFKTELLAAMQTPTHRGVADAVQPTHYPLLASSQRDYTSCPLQWEQRGALCFARSTYSGPCASEADILDLGEEQKIAWARQCKVTFPPQGECTQSFESRCPSLWREDTNGVCVAPDNYEGPCKPEVWVADMREKEKQTFSAQCGARWPCLEPNRHSYVSVCPRNWTLMFGAVCSAPFDYEGPCNGSAVELTGMTVSEKKAFEALCEVAWPKAPRECVRDFSAACPFGWLAAVKSGEVECRAPSLPRSGQCNPVQRFTFLSPAEKQDWERVCSERFPCLDRSDCSTLWSAPCPANWFSLNGGLSCMAPSDYAGNCSTVLDGLLELTETEKAGVADRCSVAWPCYGEANEAFPARAATSARPRNSYDGARYVEVHDGAVNSETGATMGRAPA